jgi:hypothetical protein
MENENNSHNDSNNSSINFINRKSINEEINKSENEIPAELNNSNISPFTSLKESFVTQSD